MRRVLCGKLPERDISAESFLPGKHLKTTSEWLQTSPADTVNRRLSDLFLEFIILLEEYETDNQGGTAITRPMDFY